VHRQKNGAALGGVDVTSIGFSFGAQTFTDVSGNYTLQGLSNGSYHLMFSHAITVNNLSGCYRNAPPHNYTADCSGNGSTITVNNANVTKKNVDLPDGHLITGTVQDAQGHDLCAVVGAYATGTSERVSQTASCGSFSIVAVPSGTYRIEIDQSSPSHFVTGSYASNAHHWIERGTFATVHVGAANVNLGTIRPDPGHTISGTIETATNQAVHYGLVTLSGSGGSRQVIYTDTLGNFSFFGVGAGTHTIFESAGTSAQNIRSGYYRSGTMGNWTANKGQATALSANADHDGIVIAPANGYSIAGQITNPAHQGVASAVTTSGPTNAFAYTDASGNYVMNGLDPGNYIIEVSPGSTSTTHYRPGYYSKTAAGHFASSHTGASTIHIGP
jgi:hypothetical protein